MRLSSFSQPSATAKQQPGSKETGGFASASA
jgi:hypothetical protein